MRSQRLFSRNFVSPDGEKPLFQLFFLRNNENQTVMVEEVKEIDFKKVKECLEQGESVFISPKHVAKADTNLVEWEYEEETWYFTRT